MNIMSAMFNTAAAIEVAREERARATQEQIISRRIAERMAEGLDVDAAIDATLGAGTFAKLVGEVCDAAPGS